MTDLLYAYPALWLAIPASFGLMGAWLIALARREARQARLYDLMTHAPLRDLASLIQNGHNIR